MVKKTARKKPVFKCKTCGKTFRGGRALGMHYNETPAHRPSSKLKKSRKMKNKVIAGFPAQLKTLLDSIDAEIVSHEQAIKDLKKKRDQLHKVNW